MSSCRPTSPCATEEPAEAEQARLCVGQSLPVPHSSSRHGSMEHMGALPQSLTEHTLLAPLTLQLNASTHCWLSDHISSGCGLATLCVASLLRDRGELPDLSMPSALAKVPAWCCRLVSSRDSRDLLQGALHAEPRAG